MVLGVGVLRFELKIARRLSTARSCALQLSGVLSALTAMVSARRQWMILSVVVSVGTDSVGCWKTTVSEIILAPHVGDMSATCRRHVGVAKSWPTLRVGPTRKSPRHTQFSSITADKYKSVRHVELSYPENISFVILTNSGSRSKKLSNNEPYHATTYNMDG